MKSKTDLINAVFHDQRHGLRYFENNERDKLKLREQEDKIDIWCAKRERWLRAKPEEVVRQLFLVRPRHGSHRASEDTVRQIKSKLLQLTRSELKF